MLIDIYIHQSKICILNYPVKEKIMKKSFYCFLLIVSLFVIQCEKSEKFNCPIVLGPRGVQMLISFESAKKICENRIEYVNIVRLEKSPVTARDFDDNVWEEKNKHKPTQINKNVGGTPDVFIITANSIFHRKVPCELQTFSSKPLPFQVIWL
jgi:hypothetical protein